MSHWETAKQKQTKWCLVPKIKKKATTLEITVNVRESVLSRKLVFWTSNRKHVMKYDIYVKFPRILHRMYKYVLNSVVKISTMFAKYFEYYAIILRGGGIFHGHAV